MDGNVRKEILSLGRTAHDLAEACYKQNTAVRGEEGWAEKQRILLADMALHLLHTSLKEDALAEEDLKRNLYAILTISDQFIAGVDLKSVADDLYSNRA